MTYRCQGCRDYHRGEPYRRLGLGSVCSPECVAVVQARQRGGRPRREVGQEASAAGPRPIGDPDSACAEDPLRPEGDHESPRHLPLADHPSAEGNRDQANRDKVNPSATAVATVRRVDPLRQRQVIQRSDQPATSGRFATVPPATRCRVLERDRCCRMCGRRKGLDVHHITYRSEGVDHQAHNLIVLCHAHHDLVHSNKRRWQPVLRAYIWLLCVEGRRYFVLDVERLVQQLAQQRCDNARTPQAEPTQQSV